MVKMGTNKLNPEQIEFVIEIVRKHFLTIDDNYSDAHMAENGWDLLLLSMD